MDCYDNQSREDIATWKTQCHPQRWKKMQELDKIETLNPEWICQPKTEGQIQNGTEQNNCDDCVDNLFKKAQKVGAVGSEHAKADTVITLWKNGFTVNEGELRSYTDVANQCFLDSIKKGQVGFVLIEFAHYALYATPRIISKVKKKVEETEERKPTIVLINSEPITRIQIWLADGARIVQNFNISHRISHIRDFIIDYQRHQGRRPFTLTTSLPFQELLNESLTLEEANLKNAVVVQRLKNNIEPFRSFSS
ncbi:hypothetical protein Chor_007004 [Crotalus horridus]